jgi:hypothetical protein
MAALRAATVAALGTSPGAVFSAITRDDGTAVFSDVDEGAYRVIVQLRGYRAFRTNVDVVAAKRTSIRIELLPELAPIGRVSSKSTVLHETLDTAPNRKVSPTLVDALNQFADVSAYGDTFGLGMSASLRNGDPSATNYAVNGVPLAGSGVGLSVNTDLLSSASVSQDNDTINFTYLAPTLDPRFIASATEGGFGESLVKISAQATSGAVGIAAAHTVRSADSVLNGQTYLDASGLSYRHVGSRLSTGNFAKVVAPVGDWNASFLVADSRAVTSPIPAYYDGALPAGDGPGTVTTAHSLNAVATANGLVGTTAVSASLSSIDVRTRDNRFTRYVNLIPSPFDAGGALHGSDLTIGAQRSISPRTSLRTTFSQTATDTAGWSMVGGAAYVGSSARQDTSALTVRSDVRGSDVVRTYTEVGIFKGDSAAWSPSATAGFTASRPSGIRYSGLLSIGQRSTAASNPRNEQGFPDAASATYDCASDSVTVTAPGDTSAHATYVRSNVGYTHEGSEGYVSIAGYYDLLRSALLTGAVVPLSAEAAGTVPAGYADELLAGFQKYGRCAHAGPTPDRMYVVQDVSGVSTRNLGLSLAASRSLSRRLVASFGAFLSSARLLEADSRLRAPTSPYQVGHQMPGRPWIKGNVVLDYAPSTLPELLLDAEYLGTNNMRNLPSNLTLNIGLEKKLSHNITLNLIVTNALDTYAGAFVTRHNAVPIATASGTFPTLAAPYPPPSVRVLATYTFDRRKNP